MDVETFIEVIERTKPGGASKKRGRKNSSTVTQLLAKRVDVLSCVKDLTNGRVSCKSEPKQLGATSTPLTRCGTTHGTYPFPELQQPAHPVEMETVVLPKGAVKTVKVEKEVLFCNGRVADLYLFTHLHAGAKAGTVRRTGTRFDGVICFKDEARGRIAECRLFTPIKAS
jgi:hypothetical protein